MGVVGVVRQLRLEALHCRRRGGGGADGAAGGLPARQAAGSAALLPGRGGCEHICQPTLCDAAFKVYACSGLLQLGTFFPHKHPLHIFALAPHSLAQVLQLLSDNLASTPTTLGDAKKEAPEDLQVGAVPWRMVPLYYKVPGWLWQVWQML